MFTTDADCQQCLADILQMTQAQLLARAPFLVDLTPRAHSWAYNQIVEGLSARGYIPVQIAGWDLGVSYEQQIYCFRMITWSQVLQKMTTLEVVKSLDLREDLMKTELIVGGLWQSPQGIAGQAQEGRTTGWHDPTLRGYGDCGHGWSGWNDGDCNWQDG